MKITHLSSLAVAFLVAASFTNAASVVHIENGTTGQFFDSTGAALTAGGVSIGYFTGVAPSDSTIQSYTAGTAFASLIAAGYVDVRNVVGATQAGGFDWAFPTVSGIAQNIPTGALPSLPTGAQLYIVAFNAGSYVAGTQGTPNTTSTSFTGATEWAIVKDNANVGPANLGSVTVRLDNAVGSEILVGSDNGINVNLSGVPEPTKTILSLGALAMLGFRRRR